MPDSTAKMSHAKATQETSTVQGPVIRRAALYARVSTEKQVERDLSIDAQIKALQAYARKRGWAVVHEFLDEAESARTANRPAFMQMIALAKQKKQ